MKTLITFLSAIVISTVSMAQITITDTDFPGIGVSLYQGVDTVLPTNIDIGMASATTQDWDFSILETDSLFQFTFNDPGEVAHGDSFPTADVAVDQFGGNGFVDVTSSSADIIGFGGSFFGLNIDLALAFQDPYTIITFPTTYGTTMNDMAELDATLYNDGFIPSFPPLFDPDSIRFKRTVTLTGEVDAFGIVTDPLGNTHDVLRQVFTEENIDTVWYYQNGEWDLVPPLAFENPATSTNINVRFISATLGYMVADFEVDENMVPLEATFLSDPSLCCTSIEEVELADFDLIYPNPTNGVLYIGKVETNSTLELLDQSGKTVFSQTVNSNQRIDVSELPKGLYLFRVLESEGPIKTGRVAMID